MSAIRKAIEAAGGQSALARLIVVRGKPLSHQAVNCWASAGRAPHKHHARIVEATGGAVTREQLEADHEPDPVE